MINRLQILRTAFSVFRPYHPDFTVIDFQSPLHRIGIGHGRKNRIELFLRQQMIRTFQTVCCNERGCGIYAAQGIEFDTLFLITFQHLQHDIRRRSIIIRRRSRTHKRDLCPVLPGYFRNFFIIRRYHHLIEQTRLQSRCNRISKNRFAQKRPDILAGYPFTATTGRYDCYVFHRFTNSFTLLITYSCSSSVRVGNIGKLRQWR